MNIATDASSLIQAEILGQGDSPLSQNDPLTRLLEQADTFCERFGVGEDVILETYTETSDWAFFIKVDALHETACRDLMARLLTVRQSGGAVDEEMSAFIDDIEFQGQGSVLRLIELTRRPRDYVLFLKCVRRVRNAFAHDFRSVNKTLMELIEPLADRALLLKAFSGLAEADYDEAKYLRLVRNDPGFLRFGILHHSMVLLCQLHAEFQEAAKEAIDSAAAGRVLDPPEAKPSPAFNGEPRLDLFGPGAPSRPSIEAEETIEPNRPSRPAAFLRHTFTNPKRPNQTRSFWTYFLVFSAKAIVAIGGFAAAVAVYSFYGIWPAVGVAVIGLIPVALDKWTPGAWKGHCPHCASQIAVAANKKIALGLSCPVCSRRIRLRDKSFIAI
ncbi:hypothetical protein RZS28_07070 [Methylocapsa polymorpha]|uniref:DUF4145 domain-containing protein n=1 Tax=Methylocapsa polymorpha TaxID=3080828 RepID=A0ABZ0HW90_9HYPH|nr:hypothetical protein RZS28_07070 [Methylocapsa sp. RX1]